VSDHRPVPFSRGFDSIQRPLDAECPLSTMIAKGRKAVALPGFNAETSLYKTGAHYRSMRRSVRSDGITIQQLSFPITRPAYTCGPCYYDENGQCARDCGYCVVFPSVVCYHWHEHCPCETEFGCPIGPCNLY
jgi:hypothetical protein